MKNCSLSVDEAAEEEINRAEIEHEEDVTHTDGHHECVPSLNNHQGIGDKDKIQNSDYDFQTGFYLIPRLLGRANESKHPDISENCDHSDHVDGVEVRVALVRFASCKREPAF